MIKSMILTMNKLKQDLKQQKDLNNQLKRKQYVTDEQTDAWLTLSIAYNIINRDER